ncbi:hypothetical protein F5Y05DRAFT_361526 [Hypoxylon sp. FL0543]|nr:hypothetical protein F5Y05DRAFT_361526 [Hypoxylon sp. FL0543]
MTPVSVEKGLLGEKGAIASSRTTRRRHRMVDKMPSARNFFLTLLLGLLVTAGLANAMLKQQHSSEESAGSEDEHAVHSDDSTFSRLLSSASPQALHGFLHAYFPGTYKHGIYDSDRSAMEVVHANDPELATSIVQLAKRQQSGNDTTSSTTPTSTETSTTTSTTGTSTSQETSTQETSSTSPTSPSDTTVISTITPTTSTETETPTTPSSSDSTQATSAPGTSADSSTEVPSETTIVTTTSSSSSTTSSSTSLTPTISLSSSSRSSSRGTSSKKSLHSHLVLLLVFPSV